MAARIASFSLPAVMMTKEAVRRAEEMPLSEGLRFERRLFQALFSTGDQKEGMAAFLEKRPPASATAEISAHRSSARFPRLFLDGGRLRTYRTAPQQGGRKAAFIVCRDPRPEAHPELVRRARDAEDQGTDMANTPSAKKATRKIARRTEINKVPRTRMRGFIRKVEEAIASGDKEAARAALRVAQPHVMKAATRGLIHRNTASRKSFAPLASRRGTCLRVFTLRSNLKGPAARVRALFR